MYVRRTSAYKTPIMHFHTNKKIQETNQKKHEKKTKKRREIFYQQKKHVIKIQKPTSKNLKETYDQLLPCSFKHEKNKEKNFRTNKRNTRSTDKNPIQKTSKKH